MSASHGHTLLLFFTICGIVVWLHCEQPEHIALPVSRGAARLCDAQGIQRVYASWRFHAAYFFPLQAWVAVELLPAQLDNFFERVHHALPLCFVQPQPCALKNRIIQI